MSEECCTVMDSPVGRILLRAEGGVLTAIEFQRGRVGKREAPPGAARREPLREAIRQLKAYFRGELQEFDLEMEAVGTEFQRRTWKALQGIPYGHTISYAELARRIGNPKAVRAVGTANGSNPLSIVIPCHRVIGSDGKLTGYGGGLDIKQQLLELEGARLV
jgi:methylated-DNA-[protein]-cysteine S-methyltransferase